MGFEGGTEVGDPAHVKVHDTAHQEGTLAAVQDHLEESKVGLNLVRDGDKAIK